MRLSRQAHLEFPVTHGDVGPSKPRRGRKRELLLLGLLGVLMTGLFLSWSHVSFTEDNLKAKSMRALVGTGIDPRQVSVDGQKVTLRGTVPFEGLRSLVAESIATVEGVRVINNELTVAAPLMTHQKSN